MRPTIRMAQERVGQMNRVSEPVNDLPLPRDPQLSEATLNPWSPAGSVGEGVQERVDGGVVLGHPPDRSRLPIAEMEDLGVLPLGAGPVPGGGPRAPQHDHVL